MNERGRLDDNHVVVGTDWRPTMGEQSLDNAAVWSLDADFPPSNVSAKEAMSAANCCHRPGLALAAARAEARADSRPCCTAAPDTPPLVVLSSLARERRVRQAALASGVPCGVEVPHEVRHVETTATTAAATILLRRTAGQ